VARELGDDGCGDFARRLAELLAQRHRAVGLVVAELGVLARQDHVGERGRGLVARYLNERGGESAT
jgi:hypothetical protein